MFHIPHDLIGTIPGWITSAGVLALLTLLSRHYLAQRKLGMDGEAGIRDHYAREVAALRGKLDNQSSQFRKDLLDLEDRYRKLLDEAEERHNACLSDRDSLRERVKMLEDELRGLIRVITQASIDRVLMLHEDLPDDIREAAGRVEQIIQAKGRE